ncbi:DUF1851 domain-containing protein [Gordonia sp. ABSL49_1]|uniref:DUF1851 domain-containing protein n=1 Tax=unclassified Gordonia (in: high G+C Gram-positive bacteria) TaxID=2657482 RepID=UPI001F0CF697|nr:DUF1851 domain-containing protein [Gordonia sp. ABSL49_1]MCH5644255.1 DUF1851 domain-containing protein [Gordonia sp. ABSL49_1]
MKRLLQKFRCSSGISADASLRYDSPISVAENFGGLVLEGGLFRIYTRTESQAVGDIVAQSDRALASHVEIVGGDWLGRFWAWDTRALDDGGGVTFLDPGEGEFEVPGDLRDLFDKVLPDMGSEVLELDLYNEWRVHTGTKLDWMSCASMIVPFELGGELVVSNLELTDLSVHWGLASQISQQLRQVDPGASVRFSIGEADS